MLCLLHEKEDFTEFVSRAPVYYCRCISAIARRRSSVAVYRQPIW